MADDNQDPGTGTDDKDPATKAAMGDDQDQKTGTDDKSGKEGGDQTASDDLFTAAAKAEIDKRVRSETDRRVTAAVRKVEEKAERRVEEALRRAQQEAEEAKLLEDGKVQELFEREKARTAELEARIAEREFGDKVDQLLDKREIVDPELRRLFHSVQGELTDVDALITGVEEIVDREVEKRVADRLKTPPPPPGSADKQPKSDQSLQERRDEAERKAISSGETKDWDMVTKLNNDIQDEISRRAHA